jgi:hypothetical protein
MALTSPTSGGRSVGIVRLRTKTTEFLFMSDYTEPNDRMTDEQFIRKNEENSRGLISNSILASARMG